MYVTADGQESIHEVDYNPLNIGAGRDDHDPKTIKSYDVRKVGMIITRTPRTMRAKNIGGERLFNYFKMIEGSIAAETAARKKDIDSIRAQMAKNMELNEAARSKMKKMLLHKMAVNAKIAKDDLDRNMRIVQRHFAATAEFENKRYKKNLKRSAHTREIMRKNKKLAQHNLAVAVLAQQRSLAALAQSTAAKIKATDKRIHTNAVTIVENAKKAREALDHAMNNFDHKMANIEEEAKKGRSKLAAQAASQDKKFRQMANNKVKAIVAHNAAEFAKVRKQMAKDRAAADKAVADASKRMDAALKAQAALNNKRFASTVADIKAAKAEASARVKAFKTSYKASILGLQAVAEGQIKKLNKRQSDLAQTVSNNKLDQARTNDKVNKELDQMVSVGKKRYNAQLKKDRDLEKLMAKNAQDTAARMARMKNNFMEGLGKIKKQMKKDRAFAEHQLGKATDALYANLKANAVAQEKINKKITADTGKAGKEAAANLKLTTEIWAQKLAVTNRRVDKIAAKHNKQVLHLTGIVEANAIKDKKGRDQLKKVQAFNKAQVKGAIADAIKKGEARAQQIEKRQKAVNKKMRAKLNTRIVTEISHLKKKINGQLLELRYNTPASRALMRRQVDQAVTVALAEAKQALQKTVAWAEGKVVALNAHFKGKASPATAAKIAKAKAGVMAKINDAVAGQEKALFAFKTENIRRNGFQRGSPLGKKKKHFDLTAASDAIIANAKAVEAEMGADVAALNAKLEKAKKKAVTELEAASPAAAARYAAVVKDVEVALKKAAGKANSAYSATFVKMAEQRKALMDETGSAVANLNDAIAKYAALQNTHFSKTVKNIKAARKAADESVMDARKVFGASLIALLEKVKEVDFRVQSQIAVVCSGVGLHMTEAVFAARTNKSQKAVQDLVKHYNDKVSVSPRAKGVLRKLMNENKVAAAHEVITVQKMVEAKALGFLNKNSLTSKWSPKEDLVDAAKHLHKAIVAKAAPAIKKKKAAFATALAYLANAIAAGQKKYRGMLEEVTGANMRWNQGDKVDHKVRKVLLGVLKEWMSFAIVTSVQAGILKAKEDEEDDGTAKGAMFPTIASAIEGITDKAFGGIEASRSNIGDNYLSLKAYAISAEDKVHNYVAKGKGRALSALGDLLTTIASLSDVEPAPAAGLGFGSGHLVLPFNGKAIAVSTTPTKTNGLVDEYMGVMEELKQRWPMGLGKYLIGKLELAMSGTGALEVDKIADRAGNFVFLNGHAVGLSSKLGAFEDLAVRMADYEETLSKLTGKMAHVAVHKTTKSYVTPPEWQGN
jgi:hypothetical protein